MCVCTQYSEKRRRLADHREQMRIMMDVIIMNPTMHMHLEDRLMYSGLGVPNLEVWSDGDDEPYNKEDPLRVANNAIKALRGELIDQSNFIVAVGTATAKNSNKRVYLDLERARMQLEDLRSQLLK